MAEKDRTSPALEMISNVWTGATQATGKSWERLNQAMHRATMLAIESGMVFDRGDFGYMAENFRIGYWCGADLGESWYSAAIKAGNNTAFSAYEEWRDRKPFLLRTMAHKSYGKQSTDRLHVGSQFTWQGETVTVTSFAEDQQSLIACSYKGQGYPMKIKRRFKITHQDIREYHATLKQYKLNQVT